MAKLCNSYCKPICDTCINYQDEYRDIQKIWDFAGHGICKIDNKKTFADEYCEENFECRNFVNS